MCTGSQSPGNSLRMTLKYLIVAVMHKVRKLLHCTRCLLFSEICTFQISLLEECNLLEKALEELQRKKSKIVSAY